MDDVTQPSRNPQDWVDEGHISFEQADAIEGRTSLWDAPRLVEALLYLGMAAFSIAAIIWFGDLLAGSFWNDPNQWGAFTIAVIGACALTVLAYILNRDGGGIRRAVGVLLTIAVFMVALAIQTAFSAFDFHGQWAQLVLALLIAVAAFGAWRLRKSVPTEIALFLGASSVLLAIIEVIQEASINPDPFAVASLNPGTFSNTTAGLLVWVLGGAWAFLGWRGFLRSRNTAYLLGGTAMAGASIGLFGVNRWWIILVVITALAICAAGVHLRSSLLMVIGTTAVMIAVPLGLSDWLTEPPSVRTWVMIYGIPGLLLLLGAVVWADRIRKPAVRAVIPTPFEGE